MSKAKPAAQYSTPWCCQTKQTINEFIIQIDKIKKKSSYAQAQHCCRQGSCQRTCPRSCGPWNASGPRRPRTAPIAPLKWPLHSPAAQPPLLLAPDGQQRGQHLHLPLQALRWQLLHPHSHPPATRQPPPPPQRVRLNLTPAPPAAADPGSVFPDMPNRFFACPGKASSNHYPQRNRGGARLAAGLHLLFCR